MKTVHIEVVVEDDTDTTRLLNAVAVEASEISGTVISDFELSSTAQELERERDMA